jgi:hypothetical protein
VHTEQIDRVSPMIVTDPAGNIDIHAHRILPYVSSKKDSSESGSSNFRVSYNLHIGLMMNREVLFSSKVDGDYDLRSHAIKEEMECGSEIEFDDSFYDKTET